jgi:hypothetical protein
MRANSLQSRYDEDMTPQIRPVIVVRYCETGSQWQAWFNETTCLCYGGEFSTEAVHRLLEGSGTDACDLTLHVDRPDKSTMIQEAVWQPPELLLRCEQCDGKGEYVGLAVVEKCGTCRGRGWIAG